jgi:hypothetical protein
MNKIVLVVSLLALALSAVNTVLLVEMGGRMKDVKEKLEPVARQVEQIQPVLRGLADKHGPTPPDGPPPGPAPFPKP